MAFKATDGLPTQVISVTPTAQLVPLNSNGQPHIQFVNDTDGLVFYRTILMQPADQSAIDASADIPIVPGAYGTVDRGNAAYIAIKAKLGTIGGTFYMTFGVE